MIDNPSDQFCGYFQEVLNEVCEVTGKTGIKDFRDVVELAKVAAINLLTDTIKHTFYDGKF